MRRVELELVPGLGVEFTDRERALGQVVEWAERGTRFPVVIFGPEGCGKSAFLRQASAMLRELGFDVFFLHPLEREFRGEVAVPGIRREFVQFVERALGENALGGAAWAALDFVRKLQRARRGRIAVVADDVFQAVGLDAVAAYVKALLNLIEYPASRYERMVVLVAAGEGVSRREVGRHLWAEVAPMWNMSREGFQQLYDKIPSPKPPFDETWRLTGGNPRVLAWLYEARWNVEGVVSRLVDEKRFSAGFVARWRRWLDAAVEDPDALWSPDAPEELIDELEERNLIIYHMYRREEWAWIDQPPPEKDPEIGVGRRVAWHTPLHREAVRRALAEP